MSRSDGVSSWHIFEWLRAACLTVWSSGSDASVADQVQAVHDHPGDWSSSSPPDSMRLNSVAASRRVSTMWECDAAALERGYSVREAN